MVAIRLPTPGWNKRFGIFSFHGHGLSRPVIGNPLTMCFSETVVFPVSRWTPPSKNVM